MRDTLFLKELLLMIMMYYLSLLPYIQIMCIEHQLNVCTHFLGSNIILLISKLICFVLFFLIIYLGQCDTKVAYRLTISNNQRDKCCVP